MGAGQRTPRDAVTVHVPAGRPVVLALRHDDRGGRVHRGRGVYRRGLRVHRRPDLAADGHRPLHVVAAMRASGTGSQGAAEGERDDHEFLGAHESTPLC